MSNPVEMNLVSNDATVPPPDSLIAGPRGAVNTDVVKVRNAADGELKRGTLLMVAGVDTERVFVPCTAAGLAVQGNTFGILADTVTLAADEHTETAVYFDGDFNAGAVILTWETDADDHDGQIEAAREALRRQKIFLHGSIR